MPADVKMVKSKAKLLWGDRESTMKDEVWQRNRGGEEQAEQQRTEGRRGYAGAEYELFPCWLFRRSSHSSTDAPYFLLHPSFLPLLFFFGGKMTRRDKRWWEDRWLRGRGNRSGREGERLNEGNEHDSWEEQRYKEGVGLYMRKEKKRQGKNCFRKDLKEEKQTM